MSQEEIASAIEVIPNKLFFMGVTHLPKDTEDAHFFCTDEVFRYYNYFLDFGPLTICQIYNFCTVVDLKMKSRKFSNKRLYYYSRQDPKFKVNSILLLSCYLLIKKGYSCDDVIHLFRELTLPCFHDASPYECDFELTWQHCLEGLSIAISKNIFEWNLFDPSQYEFLERVENGDMNWIIVNRLLAFSGPHDVPEVINDVRTFTPEDYLPLFAKLGVGVVVRLNKPAYDSSRFSSQGIDFFDLYFPDGGLPQFVQMLKFIAIIKTHSCGVAVHCKAGLGRTGTLICAYLIYEFGMTAEQAIGYCRICRPGSVVGCQQHFLKRVEARLRACSEEEVFASLTAKKHPLYSDRPLRRGPVRTHVSLNATSPSVSPSVSRSASPSGFSSHSPSNSPSGSRSGSPLLHDQGSSLYHRKVANTAPEGARRNSEAAQGEEPDGRERCAERRESRAGMDSDRSGDSIGIVEPKRGNANSMERGNCDGCGESGGSSDYTRDECAKNEAVEEEEEANGERACPDSIPDVNANMDDQSNEQTDSNVSESFDSMLRVFLVCLLISLLYFTLPLFSFIFLLLAVFLFLLYGKKVEKLFS